MEIKAKVLGFRSSRLPSGTDFFEGYFKIYPSSIKDLTGFTDPTEVVGDFTYTITTFGKDATSFYNKLFDEKLLGKDVTLVGSNIKYDKKIIFKCCLIM